MSVFSWAKKIFKKTNNEPHRANERPVHHHPKAGNRPPEHRSAEHRPARAEHRPAPRPPMVVEADSPHAVYVRREDHALSRKLIAPEALKVLYRLNESGYIAYLVGGGVRDLLLGRKPKDFDVGTNAHPYEIKQLFRQCYIVGRRFRLAHVRFGLKVIETSTFRRDPQPQDAGDEEDLYQHRDNTYGSPMEDAYRRDFTINALFYDIRTFRVIDYVGGLSDLKHRLMRCIGDPNIRFREDPVRMIRAVRLAARLDFKIEEQAWKSILQHHAEITKASAPRLLEEIYRLFGFRSGAPALRLMREARLLGSLLPEIEQALHHSPEPVQVSFWKHLEALDHRSHATDDPPLPAMIWASLLFPFSVFRGLPGDGEGAHHPLQHMLGPLAARFTIPKTTMFRLLDYERVMRWFMGHHSAGAAGRVDEQTFAEARDLWHMHQQACGAGAASVPGWQEFTEQGRQTAADSTQDPQADHRPRRRRRGGRRYRRPPNAAPG
jgi:poly(A) polymerase